MGDGGRPDSALGDLFQEAAADASDGAIAISMPTPTFTLENGPSLLARHFPPVTTYVNEAWFEVPVVEPIVASAASFRGPILATSLSLDFDKFLDAVARRTAEQLPFRFARTSAYFSARDAA